MSDTSDRFADAKSNIRETVKWMAATFAALAAVVIAGSPISGLGTLPLGGRAFWLGLVFLVLAFALICAALGLTLRILRPDAIFRSDLYVRERGVRSKSDWNELLELRKYINNRAIDLLPFNYPTLESLGELFKVNADILSSADDAEPAQVQEARALMGEASSTFDRLLALGQYLRLQIRFQEALPRLLWLGIGALAFLTSFGVVVSQAPTEDKSTADTIVLIRPSDSGG